MGAEASCFGRDTVRPELVDQGLIGDQKSEWNAFETGWRRAAVDTETVEYSRTAEKRDGERVAVAHGGMTWAAHCTRGWSFPEVFSTGL